MKVCWMVVLMADQSVYKMADQRVYRRAGQKVYLMVVLMADLMD